MSTEELPIARIYPREDIQRRKVASDTVRELVKSIEEIGLVNPICVRPAQRYVSGVLSDAWEILAGHHRYEAFSQMCRETIPARILELDDLRGELAAIDENLIREPLTDAQRAHQIGRRKEIYEALHPETAHGGNKSPSGQFGHTETVAFTKATAKATGRSERDVRRDAQRADLLGDDLTKIANTSLDKGVELDALANMTKEDRAKVISLAERGEKVSARPRTGPSESKSSQWRAKFIACWGKCPSDADREWARTIVDRPIMDRRFS